MEANLNTQLKEEYLKKSRHMVELIPTMECLFVLRDANARTRKRMEGCIDGEALGAYGGEELNNNGERLLIFAEDNELALTNTFFFSTQKSVVSHTFNGISSHNDQKRIHYIVTLQAHRCRVYDLNVHPQPPPPAKADSDHNVVYAMLRFSGRFAPYRHV